MFCPDPGKALQEMGRVVRKGSRIAVIVYSDSKANPAKTIPMATARRIAGLPPGDPQQPGNLAALGDPEHLKGLFLQAGLQDVQIQKVSVPIRYPTTRDYLEFVQTAMSPVMQLVSTLESHIQQQIWEELEKQLEVFQTPEGWVGPAEMMVASALKP